MARYKHIDTSPRFLAVDLEAQLLPGTFEHALNHLLDREIDLSAFDARFSNDEVGASAYPPAMLPAAEGVRVRDPAPPASHAAGGRRPQP